MFYHQFFIITTKIPLGVDTIVQRLDINGVLGTST